MTEQLYMFFSSREFWQLMFILLLFCVQPLRTLGCVLIFLNAIFGNTGWNYGIIAVLALGIINDYMKI